MAGLARPSTASPKSGDLALGAERDADGSGHGVFGVAGIDDYSVRQLRQHPLQDPRRLTQRTPRRRRPRAPSQASTRSIAPTVAWRSSPTVSTETTSQPASVARARSAYAFELRISPGPSGSPGSTSSSPVTAIAIRGLAAQVSAGTPGYRGGHAYLGRAQAGARRDHGLAGLHVLARAANLGPGVDRSGERDLVVPDGDVLDTDHGIRARRHRRPVEIAIASPSPRGTWAGEPARDSPTSAPGESEPRQKRWRCPRRAARSRPWPSCRRAGCRPGSVPPRRLRGPWSRRAAPRRDRELRRLEHGVDRIGERQQGAAPLAAYSRRLVRCPGARIHARRHHRRNRCAAACSPVVRARAWRLEGHGRVGGPPAHLLSALGPEQAGLDPIVVAKRDTELPALEARVLRSLRGAASPLGGDRRRAARSRRATTRLRL